MEPNGNGGGVLRSVMLGALGFAVVSLGGFAVWAFAGSWFYRNVGEVGLYAASAVVFIGLAGLMLHPLIVGPPKAARFYRSFVPSFMAYVVVWSVCWFLLKSAPGEWLGSILGCAAFAGLLSRSFPNERVLPQVIAVLAIAHSLGYFAGSVIYMNKLLPAILPGLPPRTVATISRLVWGLCYGLGFGAGIGYAYALFQRTNRALKTGDSPGVDGPNGGANIQSQ